MKCLARSLPALWVLALLLQAAPASAQTRWTIDAKSSLAWWQLSPHLNHLWATTCPADPDWRPGESRSGGWSINPKLKLSGTGYSNVEDTVHLPLFPRHEVNPICVEALRGEITVGDTAHWRGVHGTIYVLGDALITGEAMRDVAMHRLLQTVQYPEIVFTLDSITNVTKNADTLVATAIGTMKIRDYMEPVTAVTKAFREGDGWRVLTRWGIPALHLEQLAPKLKYMSLGIQAHVWKHFFMGADIILDPKGGPASTSSGGR